MRNQQERYRSRGENSNKVGGGEQRVDEQERGGEGEEEGSRGWTSQRGGKVSLSDIFYPHCDSSDYSSRGREAL